MQKLLYVTWSQINFSTQNQCEHLSKITLAGILTLFWVI